MGYFRMYDQERELLIEKHRFYVKEAKSRLLAQFSDANIENEAQQHTAHIWNESGKNFNPDYHDEGILADDAQDAGIWRYELLDGLRDTTRLSIISGFFHQWEKDLSNWLADSPNNSPLVPHVKKKIEATLGPNLFKLICCSSWDVKQESYYANLDTCRLTVNVYKHGDGKSCQTLSIFHPNLFKQSRPPNGIGQRQITSVKSLPRQITSPF